MPKGDTKETRRGQGRGRPPREPKLLPPGVRYAAWREFHEPALESWLRRCDAEQLEWDTYEARCKTAVDARARGVEVVDPVPPSKTESVFACIRMCGPILATRRAETVRECVAARRPLTVTASGAASRDDIVWWIVGEALAHGIGSDFGTAYQVWFVVAEMLLRDSDIGAIIARVHPERLGRRASSAKIDQQIQNAALARQERNRVNARRLASGYAAS